MAALNWLKRNRWVVLTTLILILIGIDAYARPGGGSSFGGGGSSGRSGGGGGDGEALMWLIYLVIRYPEIGIPLVIGFIIYRFVISRNQPQDNSHQRGRPTRRAAYQQADARSEIVSFQQTDPTFSRTLFIDFAQHLYYQLHHWRGTPEFAHLRPYLSRQVLGHEAKMARAQVEVSELVIGAAYITSVQQAERKDSITVRFEANYSETHQGHTNRFQVIDQWIFVREKGIQSPGPEDMTGLHCPNCGAHLELTPTGACHQCGQVVEPGRQHWMLYRTRHLQRNVKKGVQQLGHYEQEQGNQMPTVVDPRLRGYASQFATRHQIRNFDGWLKDWQQEVVVPMFTTIYEEYESREYRKTRALMTDNMFRSHYYWIDAYKKAGMINRLENLRVTDIFLAKVELDQYYEALTVRIAASVLDYVETENGKLVGGSKRSPRKFTEYWTLIRRTGVEKPTSEFDTDHCPNCGAPVDMGMTGVCNYCRSKVTTGEFGWILGQITQDEVYYG